MNAYARIDKFLDEAGYAASSEESYRYLLRRAADWLEGRGEGKALEDISVGEYRQFLNSHEWSHNMQRIYGASLRAYLRWCGVVEHPIFHEILPRDDAPPGRSLERSDLRDLLASFDTTQPLGWRNLAILALMVETGLRCSEICRLEVGRLDMRHRKLVAQVKGKRRGERKWREAVFSEDTARFLEIWLEERPKHAKKGVNTVFVSLGGNTRGEAITPDGLRALFGKWGKKAEIGKLSPHDMRRTMAVLLIEAGAPTRLVQVLGGWDDIRMVERYSQALKPSQIDRYSPIREIVGIDLNSESVKKDQRA